MKPGYKTTEFWLTLLAHLVSLFLVAGIFPDTHWSLKLAGLAASALAQMGYTGARSKAKALEEKLIVENLKK